MSGEIRLASVQTGPVGPVITADHFGLNFVFQYERIGDEPWAKFDEVHADSGTALLRYPGGTAAETLFDITNPNAAWGGPNGDVQLEPLDDFLAYCRDSGAQAILTLPTNAFLTETYSGGHRGFDADHEAEIRQFLRDIFAYAFDDLHTLELGNEYEAYMTSTEYGRVASRLAEIVQEEIDQHVAGLDPPPVEAPDIAVQIWSQSVTGTTSFAELETRNDVVMSQFSTDALAAVDTVTTHYYYLDGRYEGTALHQTLANLDSAIETTLGLADGWSAAKGETVATMVSEWNVNHNSTDMIGLRQWPYLLTMLPSFVANGVETLSFWSAQYHPTSLANGDGSTTPAGALFAYMADNLTGLSVVDIDQTVADAHLSAFTGDSYAYLFVSSLTAGETGLSVSTGLFDGFTLAGATRVGVDPDSADGMFKGVGGYAPYAEPDVDLTFTPSGAGATLDAGVTLGAYETLILVYESDGLSAPPTVAGENDVFTGSFLSESMTGTGADEIFRPGTGHDVVDGGGGHDILDLADLDAAVTLHIDDGVVEHTLSTAQFTGIERIIGTGFGDRLVAGSGIEADLGGGDDVVQITGGTGHAISTGTGADQLFLHDGSGQFDLGAGDDFVMALTGAALDLGAGDDRAILFGGDDRIEGGAGADTITTGGGADTLIFAGGFGQDVVTDADVTADILVFTGSAAQSIAAQDFSLQAVAGGAQLVFTDGSSIDFLGLDASALADWLLVS